jgi:diguanylate cyclase (GGDEF)-like protein/PAS domain S-box-containing protein
MDHIELDDESDSAPGLQRHAGLFRQIINLLPVGVTVQAQDGRFMLVNDAAAAQFGATSDVLIGVTPATVLPPDEAKWRRERELALIESGNASEPLETFGGTDGARTLLTTQKPVRIADETLIVSASFDISERKQAEDDLKRRACFDELTGLANRRVVEQQVDALIDLNGADGRFALAFIDLDNFKHINDYYSHAIGDALLINVARRIDGLIRESDMLARISGDEFVLVLNPIGDDEQLYPLVARLLDAIKQPFYIEGFEILTSASVGVSAYPEHGDDYETLRRNADAAMYRAKDSAKGSVVFFDSDVGQSMASRMEQEQRLRLAIRDRQFRCAFQPKVDLRTHEVVGFEALVRLRDAGGEIQGPSDFVQLAIELGLIDDITRQVVAETAKSIERLDEAFGHGTTFSINIAARQAGDLTFMQSIAELLRDTGQPDRFMIEVTEEAFLHRSAFQSNILPMLREIGVRVSIDDFGTGYSSLSVLADITADEIKVDRSFITAIHQRPRSQSVLKAIESLSHALGMTIIAEGVETFEELAYLQAATRIHLAQGYYFSQPFLLEDMSSRLGGGERNAGTARERAETRGASTGRVASSRG